MIKENVIIISLDEVRPDHLSCYGYKKIDTPAIDQIAKEGVKFETCISSADFTPIAMGSVITGKYPNKHGMRDPYSHITGPSIANILREVGYITAGFVGNGLLSKRHGFAEGFNFWGESSRETSWKETQYPGADSREMFYTGYYWVEDFFQWLEANYKNKFFIWGHFYETHEGSEHSLLQKGLLKKGENNEFSYYDAKIKMADTRLVKPLIDRLKKMDIYHKTLLVIMSDHGTNLGEHSAKQIPWRKGGIKYPQHITMYDHDLKVILIIKGMKLPKGVIINNMVRSIDLTPTILDLLDIPLERYQFDGESLLPLLKEGRDREYVYSEDLFKPRGEGALQSIRGKNYKFIRNLTLGTEEYYDVLNDILEQKNIIDKISLNRLIQLRKKLNSCLLSKVYGEREFPDEEKEVINQRLRSLGYIE